MKQRKQMEELGGNGARKVSRGGNIGEKKVVKHFYTKYLHKEKYSTLSYWNTNSQRGNKNNQSILQLKLTLL